MKLLNLRADSKILTYTLNWLPIFCAVTFANEYTFDVLVDWIPARSLPKLKDSRGWTSFTLLLKADQKRL